MKIIQKRILPLLLCVCLLCGLLSGTASAATMSVSDAAMELIAGWEGYLQYYTGGYIGYGTAVSASAYPNGISREGAWELMRTKLDEIGTLVENFFTRNGVTLTQQQYDALCCLAYNYGPGYLNKNYRICKTIIEGNYTNNDLASALGVWCHIGSTVNSHLAKRRSAEAAIFLFGDYSGTGDRFRWVVYDDDGGSIATDIRYYETGLPYGELQTATKSGYELAGWYTADGVKLTADTVVTESLTVTARWVEAGTAVDPELTPSQTVEPVPDEPADTPEPEETVPEEPVEEPEDETTGPESPFSDLSAADDWYFGEVVDLVSRGVVDGYTDGTFRGANPINRAQILKLVLRAAGYPEQEKTGNNWASGYYDLAVSEGFLEADAWPDLTVRATRLDIAQLACAALKLPASDIESPFADLDDPSANALYEAGIFRGKYNTEGSLIFAPESGLYRGETCVIIWRILNWMENGYGMENS